MDLGCDIKFEKKTEKYIPLLAALRRYWEHVEFIAFPIGRAGTKLTRTLDQLTAAFSTVRPNVEISRASKGATSPATDHNAGTHDYNMFKSLLDSLTDSAQSRLLSIIRKQEELIRRSTRRSRTPPSILGCIPIAPFSSPSTWGRHTHS